MGSIDTTRTRANQGAVRNGSNGRAQVPGAPSIPIGLPLAAPASSATTGTTSTLLRVEDKDGGVDNVVDAVGLTGGAATAAKVAFDVVGKIADIAGFVGAAIDLGQALGLFGPSSDDRLLSALQADVQEILDAVEALSDQVAWGEISDANGKIAGAGLLLNDYLLGQDHGKDRREALVEGALKDAVAAFAAIVDTNAESLVFDASKYHGGPWDGWAAWIEHAPWNVPTFFALDQNHPAPSVPDLSRTANGTARFNYPLFIGPVLNCAATVLAIVKAVEPAFRTTGRFRQELIDMRNELAVLGAGILDCLQWTRDYDPRFDYPASFIPDAGIPVGAVDVGGGASVFDGHYSDGIEWELDPSAEPPVRVTNLDEFLAGAGTRRFDDLLALLDASAVPTVKDLVANLDYLTTTPTVSETVSISTHRSGNRQDVGKTKRIAPGSLTCDPKEYIGERYDVFHSWRIDFQLQPSDFGVFWQIPYSFWIESHLPPVGLSQEVGALVQRVAVLPGSFELPLEAWTFEWQVPDGTLGTIAIADPVGALTGTHAAAPYSAIVAQAGGLEPPSATLGGNAHFVGDDDVPDLPGVAVGASVKSIALDVDLTQADGSASVVIANRPGGPSFDHVYFVIEEIPGPAPGARHPIRTLVPLGQMISTEIHLPDDYFLYRSNCILASGSKLAEFSLRYAQLVNVTPGTAGEWDEFLGQLATAQERMPGLDWGALGLPYRLQTSDGLAPAPRNGGTR
jgi:hypothetical protein